MAPLPGGRPAAAVVDLNSIACGGLCTGTCAGICNRVRAFCASPSARTHLNCRAMFTYRWAGSLTFDEQLSQSRCLRVQLSWGHPQQDTKSRSFPARCGTRRTLCTLFHARPSSSGHNNGTPSPARWPRGRSGCRHEQAVRQEARSDPELKLLGACVAGCGKAGRGAVGWRTSFVARYIRRCHAWAPPR